jgi:hypothetical protein
MKYLSRADWKLLEELNVGINHFYEGHNHIGDEGALHLTRAKW